MELREFIISHFNFWIYVILMMIGLYAMITKNNLIKKLIGMSIFQTAIILFFVSLGVKTTGGIPILEHHGGHGEEDHVAAAHYAEPEAEAGPAHAEAAKVEEGKAQAPEETAAPVMSPDPHGQPSAAEVSAAKDAGHGHHEAINPDEYANPLPHVLMLTAIVVGVATLGVALAITQFIYKEYGTLEEKDILEQIRSASTHG